MKKLNFLILPMAIGLAGWMLGGTARGQDEQLRKDIDSHMVDLRQAEAGLDKAQADLSSAKRDMAILEKRTYDFDEMRALRARIEKDRADVATYTARMLSDISFFQTQWSYLSEAEKDTVKRASQSLE